MYPTGLPLTSHLLGHSDSYPSRTSAILPAGCQIQKARCSDCGAKWGRLTVGCFAVEIMPFLDFPVQTIASIWSKRLGFKSPHSCEACWGTFGKEVGTQWSGASLQVDKNDLDK